jgi:hypothetical protein
MDGFLIAFLFAEGSTSSEYAKGVLVMCFVVMALMAFLFWWLRRG